MTTPRAVSRLVHVDRNRSPQPVEAQAGQIDRSLTSSRRNNAPPGITGALRFGTDRLARTLESSMETPFERLRWDGRHRDTVIPQAGPVDARESGDRSMAYAGRHGTDRLRFDEPTGVPGPAGQGKVPGLLREVVLRAAPGLVPAA